MSGGDIANDGVGSRNGVGAVVKVNIRVVNGPKFFVRVNLNSTVKDFRAVITRNCAVRGEQQLLIYNGRLLTDNQTLMSFGLEDGEIVDLIRLRDQSIVNLVQRQEELVQDLENLDLSALENLGYNPETHHILYTNNSRMLAICDRNLRVLRRINGGQIESPSHHLLAARTGTENMDPNINHWDSAGGTIDQLAGTTGIENMDPSINHWDSAGSIDQMRSPPISEMIPNIAFNPQLLSMLRSNPQIRDVLQDSQVIRQGSPEIWQMVSQQIADFHRAQSISRRRGAAQNDRGTNIAAAANMLNYGSRPLEKYVVELSLLWQMGFTNIQENIRSLFDTAGNLESAVQLLRGNQSK